MNNIQETSRRQKAIQGFLGKKSKVNTFGIITAENPMGFNFDSQENKKRNNDLLDFFRGRQYIYFPVKGKFGNTEKPFMVYNITLEDMEIIGHRFDQKSFIYAEVNKSDDEPRVIFYYYQKQYSEEQAKDEYGKPIKQKDREYQLIETKDVFCRLDNDADDNFTAIGRNFKFTIPFDLFNEAITRFEEFINERCEKHPLYKKRCIRHINESLDTRRTYRGRFVSRAELYGDHYEKFLK